MEVQPCEDERGRIFYRHDECPCGEYWKDRCQNLGLVLLLVLLSWVGSICGLVWYFVPRTG